MNQIQSYLYSPFYKQCHRGLPIMPIACWSVCVCVCVCGRVCVCVCECACVCLIETAGECVGISKLREGGWEESCQT